MKKICNLIPVAALALVMPFSGIAGEKAESNQFLIELNGQAPADIAITIEAAGGTMSHDMSAIGYVTAVSENPKFALKLKRNKNIRSVQRDMVVQWQPEMSDLAASSSDVASQGLSIDPNDAYFGACQWANSQINVADAWAKGYTGQGVKVAVIDSGVDPFHQDMAGQVDWEYSTSMISEGDALCDEVSEAVYGVKDSETFFDFRYHGTIVAGEIAAHGLGTAGVAPDSQIVAIKALHCLGSGSFGDLAAALYYAANVPGVEVINMSLGAYFERSPGIGQFIGPMTRAINYANSKGILVVSAAGNDGADLQHDKKWISVPAELGAGISAWAGGIEENLASYSNHGVNAAQLGAGGGSYDVPSAQIPLPGCLLNESGQYGIAAPCSSTSLFFSCGTGNSYLSGGTGTSFSAPMVAGVAALLDGKYEGALNAGELKTALKMTADDVGAPGADNEFGHGRVNADAATDY